MIKKYWKLIVSIIAGIFGFIFLFSKSSNSKKSKAAKKKIDDNTNSINKLDGRIEEIKKQSPPKKVVKSKDEAVKSAAANIRRRTRK